jgi:hypothetical protein
MNVLDIRLSVVAGTLLRSTMRPASKQSRA